jgi:8-hydroxy-5-deazaflavin:NADPH oxidoreductase
MQLADAIGFVAVDCGGLRQARLVEGLGDFIRFMIMGQLQNPYATISVDVLPRATSQRLGGRLCPFFSPNAQAIFDSCL